MNHCDGFTVLAIFLDSHKEDNPALAPIIDAVAKALKNNDQKAPVIGNFDLSQLLPGNLFCKFVISKSN